MLKSLALFFNLDNVITSIFPTEFILLVRQNHKHVNKGTLRPGTITPITPNQPYDFTMARGSTGVNFTSSDEIYSRIGGKCCDQKSVIYVEHYLVIMIHQFYILNRFILSEWPRKGILKNRFSCRKCKTGGAHYYYPSPLAKNSCLPGDYHY